MRPTGWRRQGEIGPMGLMGHMGPMAGGSAGYRVPASRASSASSLSASRTSGRTVQRPSIRFALRAGGVFSEGYLLGLAFGARDGGVDLHLLALADELQGAVLAPELQLFVLGPAFIAKTRKGESTKRNSRMEGTKLPPRSVAWRKCDARGPSP